MKLTTNFSLAELTASQVAARQGINNNPTAGQIENLKRPEVLSLPVAERITNFNEVELGYTEDDAVTEARRCLRCDLELVED